MNKTYTGGAGEALQLRPSSHPRTLMAFNVAESEPKRAPSRRSQRECSTAESLRASMRRYPDSEHAKRRKTRCGRGLLPESPDCGQLPGQERMPGSCAHSRGRDGGFDGDPSAWPLPPPPGNPALRWRRTSPCGRQRPVVHLAVDRWTSQAMTRTWATSCNRRCRNCRLMGQCRRVQPLAGAAPAPQPLAAPRAGQRRL